MEKLDAIEALAALAQENRLDVYRLLVEAGPEGMAAGEVAARLKVSPNTLTFHFDRLRHAALVTVRREGRSMIYAARFDTMNDLLSYLADHCCDGNPARCKPAGKKPLTGKRRVSA
jgi:DNA-binding transcriptional ArsR family regulator